MLNFTVLMQGLKRKLAAYLLASLAIIPSVHAAQDLDFQSMNANGTLLYYNGKIQNTGDAKLSYIENFAIEHQKNCRGVSLDSNEHGNILTIGQCSSGIYVLCPGGLEHCGDEGDEAEFNENIFQQFLDFNKVNYRVELYTDKLIYRLQKKKCFIPYPHGCLIKGFGWRDITTFTFIELHTLKKDEE